MRAATKSLVDHVFKNPAVKHHYRVVVSLKIWRDITWLDYVISWQGILVKSSPTIEAMQNEGKFPQSRGSEKARKYSVLSKGCGGRVDYVGWEEKKKMVLIFPLWQVNP